MPSLMCTRAFDFAFEERGAASDGRTLEGYAAVFDTPTLIRDWDGDFEEVITLGAFKRSLAERMPVLQFDHGKDPRIGGVPIGSIQSIGEDSRGLHVKATLYDHPDVERVRQAIVGRSITGMSFRFGVPEGGDTWTRRPGQVDLREVSDVDIHELGPVVFPAYDTTTVTVRSLLAQLDPDEHRNLIRELAAEMRLANQQQTSVGRLGARSAGGDGMQDDSIRQQIADGDLLRLKGIIPCQTTLIR